MGILFAGVVGYTTIEFLEQKRHKEQKNMGGENINKKEFELVATQEPRE